MSWLGLVKIIGIGFVDVFECRICEHSRGYGPLTMLSWGAFGTEDICGGFKIIL